MIKHITDHSFEFDFLQPGSSFLDVGCRDFKITDQVAGMGLDVVSVDADDLKVDRPYHRVAIGGHTGEVGLVETPVPEGNHVSPDLTGVQQYTLCDFTTKLNRTGWDTVKLDCEGAEYEIVPQISRDARLVRRQLSVSFHEHTAARRGRDYCDEVIRMMEAAGFIAHGAKWEERFDCSPNYWDVLFIRRQLCT